MSANEDLSLPMNGRGMATIEMRAVSSEHKPYESDELDSLLQYSVMAVKQPQWYLFIQYSLQLRGQPNTYSDASTKQR